MGNCAKSTIVDTAISLPSHDVLYQLALDDPIAFEALRSKLVENFINHAPSENTRRLRGIQFRIDHIRYLSQSALGSTVRIFNLMWECFLQMNSELQDFANPKHGRSTFLADSEKTAISSSARLHVIHPRSTAERN